MQIYHNKCFLEPIDTITAFNNNELIEAFKKLEDLRNKDLYLLGYIRYEVKDIFLGKEIQSELPLLYFEVFDKYNEYAPYKPRKIISN